MQRKMDIHVQSYKTDLYKKSVINKGTELYNKMPGYIKEMGNFKAFKKELKSFLLSDLLNNILVCIIYTCIITCIHLNLYC
jgi:hypothetical protein